jgi:hypothetical protein
LVFLAALPRSWSPTLIKETSNDFVPGYVVFVGAGITFVGLLGMRHADREPVSSRRDRGARRPALE